MAQQLRVWSILGLGSSHPSTFLLVHCAPPAKVEKALPQFVDAFSCITVLPIRDLRGGTLPLMLDVFSPLADFQSRPVCQHLRRWLAVPFPRPGRL